MPRVLARLAPTLILGALVIVSDPAAAQSLTPTEARTIAKEATIYGFPLVDSYRVQHSYFVDRASPEYKGAWNEIHNTARVYTPDDKAVQTPNSDTPYSMLGLDLRAEPVVLTFPAVDKGRYYSAQFIDAYTFNFAYVGSRATGNAAGKYLVAGPRWNGEKPAGIKAIIRAETDLVLVVYRTQLLGANDLDNVKRVQSGYGIQPLSAYLGRPAPPAAPPIAFVKPLTPAEERTSLAFFDQLNFVLQFGPTHPSERELMARFAKLGIGAGKRFDASALSPETRKAVEAGMADAWKAFEEHKATKVDTGKSSRAPTASARAHSSRTTTCVA